MKVNLIGGDDVQRSLNLSDSKCINLYATTNNDGSIAAFYKVDGLKTEGTLNGIATGAYKTSGGRAFYVTGTTLYELTIVATVYTSTSRGTVTAGEYDFSDNGIEIIMVNGTDGWTLTLADNTLKQLKVLTGEFTVTVASPAVFTKIAHGLIAGDSITLETTEVDVPSTGILTDNGTLTLSGLNPKHVVVSADGLYAYVLNADTSINGQRYGSGPGWTAPSILQYIINADGTLSPLSPASIILMQSEFQTLMHQQGYFYIDHIDYHDLIISPDGAFLYALFSVVAMPTGFFLETGVLNYHFCACFTQSVTNGTLSYPASNRLYNNTVQYNSMVISADGESAYIANTSANTVSQYSRTLVSGVLAALSPATAAATTPARLAITSDGASVCVLGNDNLIYNFIRNTGTKLLGVGPVTISTGTTGLCKDIAIPPDNKAVYVTQYTDNKIAQYSRLLTTPFTLTALTPAELSTGTHPMMIRMSSDNANAYVTNYGGNSVSQYTRNITTFLLTQLSLPVSVGVSPYGICLSPDSTRVFVANLYGSSISQFTRSSAVPNVGLPTGLGENITYYVIAAGLTADAWEVSLTLAGDAVNTTGVQAGVHTFKTTDYGFPEGCTTVSYMNGRSIACEPGTQNFFVSEVLDNKTWDSLNVQTVDSNPDLIVGQVVSHNELIVFCEYSGEIYYDSGELPSPFRRTSSGIFEVGCVAALSIATLDNTVYWLGRSQEGTGIIYKMSGSSPQRVSNYGIEWQIQQMTTVSDARAFAYQKDGHHFYVITFPTGNKTFVYDVNTSLWHERAATTYYPFIPLTPPSVATGVAPAGIKITPDNSFAYVANSGGSSISQYSISATGLLTSLSPATVAAGSAPYIVDIAPLGDYLYAANAGSNTVSQYSINISTGVLTPLSPSTVATGANPTAVIISKDGLNAYVTNYAASTISQYSRNIADGKLTPLSPATIATGNGCHRLAITPNGNYVYSSNLTANTTSMFSRGIGGALTALSPATVATTSPQNPFISADNLYYYVANGAGSFLYQFSIGSNGQLSPLSPATASCGAGPSEIIVETSGLDAYCVSASSVTAYTVASGIFTLYNSTAASGLFGIDISSNDNYLYVTNYLSANTVSQYEIVKKNYTYTEWPVKNYLYFNGEHLLTSDTTTAIYSIDSATYKNGAQFMQWKRSFRAPQSEMKYARHSALILEAETGTGSSTQPTVTLKWSDDNGNTYNTGMTKDMGITGDYAKPINFYRLGATKGYPRIYEISGSSDAKTVLLAAYLE